MKRPLGRIYTYNNLTQRILVGLAGASILIPSIIISEWSYFAVFLVIYILTQLEFYKVAGLDGFLPLKTWGTLSGAVTFTLTFLIQGHTLDDIWYFLLLPFFYGNFFIKLYKKDSIKPFTSIALTILGLIYVAIPFSLINFSAYTYGPYRYSIVLGILMILWASDVGAYFAGVRFGKRKLFERVSPKKTWEGFLGGMFLACLMAYSFSRFFDVLNFWKWIVLAIIIVITGTYGDLIESMFKRSMKIKDSASSIPGHGGFLDRFDALLIASPFITAFLRLTLF
ncbi:MAG: phosphatidate cytidylyltransferase [Bacteroidota bacterium]